jgi:adenylosuccinate lyase
LSPALEKKICARLGLRPASITSQVIQRDRHAFYLCTLAVISSSLDKIALEIRGLQRTEVREVEEYFSCGQKGSSAMPHKRNPVTAEQICGLARVVRANAQAALENVALWHERDISHSSVERVILPDSTILLDYLLDKTAKLVETMFVYPDRMRENIDLLKGLIFSGQLLLDLVKKGAAREEAYQWVQRNAMEVWQTGEGLRTLVERDPDIRRYLQPREIARAFSLERQLRHVGEVFRRVFGKSGR